VHEMSLATAANSTSYLLFDDPSSFPPSTAQGLLASPSNHDYHDYPMIALSSVPIDWCNLLYRR
jgi:hypothetical protein